LFAKLRGSWKSLIWSKAMDETGEEGKGREGKGRNTARTRATCSIAFLFYYGHATVQSSGEGRA
jgi:hypothetical protein